jgi:hypothetical protein
MAEESPYAEAHQAIGELFCEFSALERELGETIKVILRLENHEASDAIVAALGDVGKKIQLVWAAAQLAKNADGSETTKEWKEAANKTMKAISARNDIRVLMAHSYLEPRTDGSIAVARLTVRSGELKGREGHLWKQDDFKNEIKNLKALAEELQSVKGALSALKITLPELGWFRELSQPTIRRTMAPTSLDVEPVPVPENDIATRKESSE